MVGTFSERLIKLIEYGRTPFKYPDRFFQLWSIMLTNRRLIAELVQISKHRKWYEKNGFKTIIDVGGFIGAYALAMKTILPDVSIYSFEPIKENFDSYINNMKRYSDCKIFNTALGEESGTIDFWQNAFAASSSILDIDEEHIKAFPETASRNKIQVPIARLDDYENQMELIHPVLLKLDVQGYEDKVLNGSKQILKNVDYVIAEVSFSTLYSGQALFRDIYQIMLDSGFKYGGNFENLISPKDGTILQADALFYRS